MNYTLMYVLFVLACLVLSAIAAYLIDRWNWRRTYGQQMRHRRGIKRGRGHTRHEEDD